MPSGNYACAMSRSALILSTLFLAACGREEVVVVPIDDGQEQLVLTPSPDTQGALWSESRDGQAIEFGAPDDAPLLSLACTISTSDTAPQITVIRHARSQPGAKALFAILGNGIATRLNLDAQLADGEGWRWQGTFPAVSGDFDVFTGPRGIEATLPGAGTVNLPASSMPGQFISWCRRNGEDA